MLLGETGGRKATAAGREAIRRHRVHKSFWGESGFWVGGRVLIRA